MVARRSVQPQLLGAPGQRLRGETRIETARHSPRVRFIARPWAGGASTSIRGAIPRRPSLIALGVTNGEGPAPPRSKRERVAGADRQPPVLGERDLEGRRQPAASLWLVVAAAAAGGLAQERPAPVGSAGSAVLPAPGSAADHLGRPMAVGGPRKASRLRRSKPPALRLQPPVRRAVPRHPWAQPSAPGLSRWAQRRPPAAPEPPARPAAGGHA